MRTIRGRAGLLAAAIAVGLAVVTLLVYSPPTKEVLLAGGSGPLVAKLETLLKAKEARKNLAREKHRAFKESAERADREELAAAAVDWKKARPDWKPFNPSLSLTQNELARQQEGDARETALDEQSLVHKLALHDSNHRAALARTHVERYQADMYRRTPKKACSDWGSHPIDCIRAKFHNHLKGTKFAPLRRHYDGHVTEDSLEHERNLISQKVSEGLITGNIKPPKHNAAMTSWLHNVRAHMRAARKLAMKRALAARIKEEELHADESKVAKEWGSGIAASGPDAGRRYYVNYKTGQTLFSAPKYVKHALRDIRIRKKAAARRAVEKEASLYEEGFRAAQRAILLRSRSQGRTISLHEVPQARQVLQRAVDAHAQEAIRTFLKGGGRAGKQRTYSRQDLARERARIARKLGFKSLTHDRGRTKWGQALLAERGAGGAGQRQQKVVVDAWGRPMNHWPTSKDYPAGSGDYAPPPPTSGVTPKSAASSPGPREGLPVDAGVAVAKAVASLAAAVTLKTNALQSQVSAQDAIIKGPVGARDMLGRGGGPGKARSHYVYESVYSHPRRRQVHGGKPPVRRSQADVQARQAQHAHEGSERAAGGSREGHVSHDALGKSTSHVGVALQKMAAALSGKLPGALDEEDSDSGAEETGMQSGIAVVSSSLTPHKLEAIRLRALQRFQQDDNSEGSQRI